MGYYKNCRIITFILSVILTATSYSIEESLKTVKMVPFQQVRMDDVIWSPRIKMLVNDTLPHAFVQTQVAQKRLQMCAEYRENKGGPKPEAHRFNTSDLYKVMEGAALMISAEPNPGIESQMDRIIEIIARAQQDDGYLYVSHICGNPTAPMGLHPYSKVLDSHELYNIGHLYEAAVAYAQATGKTRLLDVAEKSARHVNRVFFVGDPNYNGGKPVNQAPGHEEIELGLMKLYNYTGNKLYLDMAKRFLDIRGVTFIPQATGSRTATYAQQHLPVAKQTEAVGHAVRATYLYAAMAEADSLLGTDDFSYALDSIWHDIVDTKMHITGGLGAVRGIEGFGPSYVLSNKDAYLETCAAVGNVFFNMRMFLKYHDAKYVDVAEIALLNNCLSGIGLSGKDFFYPNPLEADYDHHPRSGWFGCACCPSNIARLIPQIPGYMYATDGTQLYCNLYGGNTTHIELNGTKVAVRQTTNYPYAGQIDLLINPENAVQFKLNLRIPSWAGTQLLPGKLYNYSESAEKWTLEINGKAVSTSVEKGFAVLERTWKPGDKVKLILPMPVKVNTCLEQVEANRGRVSISRGPLVYCAEGIDNNGAVQRFFVNSKEAVHKARIETIDSGILAGMTQITIPAEELTADGLRGSQLKMIPYYAWSNRDRSSMMTWIGTRKDLAQIDARDPRNMKFSAVSASYTFENDTVEAIRMRNTPRSSSDTSIPRWTSWPQKGTPQWIEIDLGRVQEVMSVGVYWYNDNGGVQLPADWYLQARTADRWIKVDIYNTDEYSTLADNYNTVHPAEILETDLLRIVINPRHDQTCVGILAVDVVCCEKQTKTAVVR